MQRSRLQPGGTMWLLRHELRLGWRSVGGKRIWVLMLGGVIWATLHFLIWSLLSRVTHGGIDHLPPVTTVIAGSAFWLLASIMVSQTVAHAVAALFDRGDLDLLLASPLAPRAIFAIRGVGIAVAACFVPAMLLLPVAHVGPLVGMPGLLCIYPVIMSMALFSAGTGMALTMSLVRMFGPRRAKIIAQVAAALIGAGFFLLSQAQSMLPKSQREALISWFNQEIKAGGMLSPDSAIWWPVKAMQGEPVALLTVMAVGVGGFWLVVNVTYRRFITGTQETISGGRTRKLAADAPVRFGSGLSGVLLMKEWKLLARDPQIISQTLLQVLYLIPLMFIGFRSDRTAWMIVPGFVVIVSMLAGNLAWLTLAAEDAPELIGTAPVPMARIRRLKAMAAILPVLALLLPLALWWLMRHPGAALILLFCCVGGMVSAAMCHIWNPRRGNRRDMKQRYRESKLTNMLESLGAFGWAGLALCLNGHWLWSPLALAVIIVGTGSAWVFGRSARRSGALV